MPLSLQALIENGLVDALANCFTNPTDANLLLIAIDFPAAYRPKFDRADTPMDYWLQVCEQIAQGRTQGGFETLLSAASGRLPGNPVFAPFAHTTAKRASIQSTDPVVKEAIAYAGLVCEYDVFISYSSKDYDMVLKIAEALKQQGIKPWLDRWALNYGDVFSKEIQAILSRVKVVLVCYGTDGYGPWQEVEVDVAFGRSVRNQCLIIPLMLPGVTSKDLPPFLGRLHGVQISDSLQIDTPNFPQVAMQIAYGIRHHAR